MHAFDFGIIVNFEDQEPRLRLNAFSSSWAASLRNRARSSGFQKTAKVGNTILIDLAGGEDAHQYVVSSTVAEKVFVTRDG
jgi:hypothetical protein